MKIGIIVHSKTGKTLECGQAIADSLKAKGHSVELTRLTTDVPVDGGSPQKGMNFTITNLPDCKKYDFVLVGGPVWAFSASPVAISCLQNLKNIRGKKVLLFVTMGFPFPFMGGSRALSQMQREARKAGAEVLQGRAVPNMLQRDQRKLKQLAAGIAQLVS